LGGLNNGVRVRGQKNVQQQVRDCREQILETARAFELYPERYDWLPTLLATYALDRGAGILVELRSVPDQRCWVHYGIWLTNTGQFIKFVADETYGASPLDGSGRLEASNIEDITESTSVAEFVPGIGRSFGFLALEVLSLLCRTRVQQLALN
jgi:hypothetical protein